MTAQAMTYDSLLLMAQSAIAAYERIKKGN
jgi:hypothetical protein